VRAGAVVRVEEFDRRDESVDVNAKEEEVEIWWILVLGLWWG